jgi:hypothetical protein
LRDIDVLLRLICRSFTPQEGATMVGSEWKRRIGGVLAAVALCAAVAGCAADVGTPKSERSDGGGQMRYYGGPKSPMWPSQ